MKKLLWITFFCAFAMFAAFGLYMLDYVLIDVEKQLADSANALNKDVPQMLDPHTDFIGVRTEGKEIVYLFRMHGISKQTVVESEEKMRSNKLSNIRNDPDMQGLLKKGVRMSWNYYVGDELTMSFSIDKDSQT